MRVEGTWRFADATWDDALDELERLAQAAGDSVVLALSGSETVEIASALSQLVRNAFGSHRVVLPEEASTALEGFGAPLSAIADAQVVVVIGDDPVSERAPVVDLWIRAARRNGAEVMTFGPAGTVPRAPGDGAAVVAELADKRTATGKRLHSAERVALIWSGPGGRGGGALAPLAEALALADKHGSGAYFLPATPNGKAVAAAWKAAGEGTAQTSDRIGLLLISGEEAVADPRVRELAERSDAVVAVTMFGDAVRGWTHLVLPGTSYLERDGTMVNLEGRAQRLHKATEPPSPGELEWIPSLAARFHVAIELPRDVPQPTASEADSPAGKAEAQKPPVAPKLRLARYRALFSGSAVERVPQLQFQRPEAVIELSPEDAQRRSIAAGDTVTVLANGTSIELRARINKRLVAGAARAAEEHVRELPDLIEVRP